MKRDPLQRGPTAYDVLGVGPDAGNDEIDRAVSAGAGPGEAAAAAEDLRDPARRALIDLFLYQDRYLDDLAFDDPLETLSETGARRAAAERWRAVEKRGFPMPAATHSIAVLSYWEARGSGRNGPDLPTSPDVTGRLWEAALSRFAALCASEAFWTEWGVVTGNRGVGEAAAAALESGLVDELEEMAATVRGRGDVPGEARVREHLALFRSELRSARALPALRVLSGRGLSPAAIAAGPHLLAEIGLLEKVQAAVEAQHPDLLRLFSPLAHIGLLVEEKEYGSAYGALERLDPAAREAPEARELETRVHLELGLAALAADRTDEALGHWERAIDRAEVRSWVAAPVSEAALTRAKLLHSREDRDGAILLLQRTLPLAERGILGVPLAHFLLERATGGSSVRRPAPETGRRTSARRSRRPAAPSPTSRKPSCSTPRTARSATGGTRPRTCSGGSWPVPGRRPWRSESRPTPRRRPTRRPSSQSRQRPYSRPSRRGGPCWWPPGSRSGSASASSPSSPILSSCRSTSAGPARSSRSASPSAGSRPTPSGGCCCVERRSSTITCCPGFIAPVVTNAHFCPRCGADLRPLQLLRAIPLRLHDEARGLHAAGRSFEARDGWARPSSSNPTSCRRGFCLQTAISTTATAHEPHLRQGPGSR
jgi:tetratricopeptide (TPR) repeat protein